MTMIDIDGSLGEGGGQILRTSLALSILTGQAFRMVNIRARRKQPGLLRQHLTAVRAAMEVGQATAAGDELGSQTLTFVPGKAKPGEYRFSIGTAGSTTLVLQTILPPLLTVTGPSRLVLEGGTHNMHAPPFDFLAKTFVPLINRMGPRVSLKLERYGFYPAGGGRFTVDIEPCRKLQPLHLPERGDITTRRVTAIVANLKRQIAHREATEAATLLNWPRETQSTEVVENSAGPGNILLIEVGGASVTEVFSGFGRLGVLAEAVASEAADQVREYLASGAAAGEHLADQLLLPFSMAGEGTFTASKLTLHAQTNIETIQRFLPVRVTTTRSESHGWQVRISS